MPYKYHSIFLLLIALMGVFMLWQRNKQVQLEALRQQIELEHQQAAQTDTTSPTTAVSGTQKKDRP